MDNPRLHHTSILGKYIVRLYTDTDDFDTLPHQTQYTTDTLFTSLHVHTKIRLHGLPVHCYIESKSSEWFKPVIADNVLYRQRAAK